MKRNDDKIGLLVRKYGQSETTEKFEEELLDLIVEQAKFNATKKKSPGSWLAVSIIAIAITLNVGFLVYYNPFSLNPALSISTISFIVGLWGLIWIYQKHLTQKIGSV